MDSLKKAREQVFSELEKVENSEAIVKFLEYLGDGEKMNRSKYQKSYKLVLLKSFFEIANNEGSCRYDDLCERALEFYKERFKKGLRVESDDSDFEKKKEGLKLSTVRDVFNNNPYNAISGKGFMEKYMDEGVEHIRIPGEIWSLFTPGIKSYVLSVVDIYIKLYYEYLDGVYGKDEWNGEDKVENAAEVISHICSYIRSKGFTYSGEMIKNFYISLKSKPFVMLGGISGTGKSKLVELFAEAIGCTSENGRFNLIPVKPDWSDSSEVLGYRDINGEFKNGLVTDILIKAHKDREKPYFICLDEMNLARVEYYFSDILSVMESRKRAGGEIVTDALIRETDFLDYSIDRLYIPGNVYIVGTVNMDETTFAFSKKVLDRGNTIEFSNVELDFDFDLKEEAVEPYEVSNEFLKARHLNIMDCIDEKEKVGRVVRELKAINSVLECENLHFAYRVRDEVAFYMICALNEAIMEFDEAMDYCILQKILPRVQGSSVQIKHVLKDLFEICAGYTSSKDGEYEQVGGKYFEYLKEAESPKYPQSARKVARMMKSFEADGFTSYWV